MMALDSIRAVISAKAHVSTANVKASGEAVAGRSQNDFICAAKIDALFDL